MRQLASGIGGDGNRIVVCSRSAWWSGSPSPRSSRHRSQRTENIPRCRKPARAVPVPSATVPEWVRGAPVLELVQEELVLEQEAAGPLPMVQAPGQKLSSLLLAQEDRADQVAPVVVAHVLVVVEAVKRLTDIVLVASVLSQTMRRIQSHRARPAPVRSISLMDRRSRWRLTSVFRHRGSIGRLAGRT